MRRLYLVTRDLHLYVGLFLSPFVVAFSVSVFYLVHGFAQRPMPGTSDASRTVANLSVPLTLLACRGVPGSMLSDRCSSRRTSQPIGATRRDGPEVFAPTTARCASRRLR